MENGKYNPVQGREILTQPTSYGANTNPPPPLLPPTALHLTKQFSDFFFPFFHFLGDFFSLSLSLPGRKDSNSAGPNPPAKNRADIEVRAAPAKAPAEASSSTGSAKENCLSKSHQRTTSEPH